MKILKLPRYAGKTYQLIEQAKLSVNAGHPTVVVGPDQSQCRYLQQKINETKPYPEIQIITFQQFVENRGHYKEKTNCFIDNIEQCLAVYGATKNVDIEIIAITG